MNQLEQLKQYTTVVADTGDVDAIKQFHPQDATTNPSLILKAAQLPDYQHLIEQAKTFPDYAVERLMVQFGIEMLKLIPGRVSTEVPAHLSFDVQASVDAAERLIHFYETAGIDRERILIKLASTWEGVQAAKVLEAKNIHCNMTLLFCLPQAVLCAEAGATLVSPFVGRIYDWYKQHDQRDFAAHEDPGVLSVKNIYRYFKHFEFDTVVMGASFRHKGQVVALAGCDLLTISPQLMDALQTCEDSLSCELSVVSAKDAQIEKIELDEVSFRDQLQNDPMASEKLDEGIRIFTDDFNALAALLKR